MEADDTHWTGTDSSMLPTWAIGSGEFSLKTMLTLQIWHKENGEDIYRKVKYYFIKNIDSDM